MTIALDLKPDVEERLLTQAQARGVSLADFVTEIVIREAQRAGPPITSNSAPAAKNLVELFANSPLNGLNMDFERDRDYGREIEL